jgi:hypothetical protein
MQQVGKQNAKRDLSKNADKHNLNIVPERSTEHRIRDNLDIVVQPIKPGHLEPPPLSKGQSQAHENGKYDNCHIDDEGGEQQRKIACSFIQSWHGKYSCIDASCR